jgi:chromosome segregation ATPase
MSTAQLFLASVISLAIIAPSFHTASAEALNADTKKSERKYRKTKTGEGALTQGMLEACITIKSKIDEEYAKISDSKEAFDTLNNETSDLAAFLKENKEKIEDAEEKALTEYNKKLELYNKKVEELKEMEVAYNEMSTPYKKNAAQLQRECNGQPYYEDDYAKAVKKTGSHL